ncbi:MAG: aminotransferase class I/II-fold pyridoxal phosphate-dependent enzyme [Phycisphaeraceae bacterium]
MFDPNRFIADRARAIDASGIRRVFDLAASLKEPANLSIGQPDFDVPQPVKQAAIDAIERGFNRYTQTQGAKPLLDKVNALVTRHFPNWSPAGKNRPDGFGTLITSGTSGGLMLAILACVGPGDEVLIPDPYFVMYKHLVTLAGGTPVLVDTYPDFQFTAARIEPHITPRTRMLLFNSPSNPTGVVASGQVCRDVVELCERRNILLLSDEIYDEFCYGDDPSGDNGFVSPAAISDHLLLLRGFSKTYGMTGWRLGWAVGPAPIINQMTKLQQYSFVCAPSMAQLAGVVAMDMDMSSHVAAYRKKRDRVVQRLSKDGPYELTTPGGAFYAFPRVPEKLGLTATQFVERAIERNLLIIPGSVFSSRDTHFRISYACDDAMLDRGLDILLDLASEAAPL